MIYYTVFPIPVFIYVVMDKEDVVKPIITIRNSESNQIQQYDYKENIIIEEYLINALRVFFYY